MPPGTACEPADDPRAGCGGNASALSHQVPGRHVSAVSDGSRERFRLEQLGLNSACDTLGDCVLDGKGLRQLHLISLGPDLICGVSADQLRRNADMLAGSAHTSFQQISHAEFTRDLLGIGWLALVDKARISADHPEPPESGQGRRVAI